MTRALLLAMAVATAPAMAAAEVYNIHVGGACSTRFAGTASGGRLGQWPGQTSVDARVDQTASMATATRDLAAVFDRYCTGDDWCYVYGFSNGGAVISRALALHPNADDWRIVYAYVSASNEGGSDLADQWVADWAVPLGDRLGLGCDILDEIGPTDHRAGWNHDDTAGVPIYLVAGHDPFWFSFLYGWVFPNDHDGLVDYHSAGGLNRVYRLRDTWLCYRRRYHWASHYPVATCTGYDRNHQEMKMQAVCNDGGC